MNTIKVVSIGICAAALIGTSINILLPDGSVSKTARIVLSAFFISVFVLSFSANAGKISDLDIEKYFTEEKDYSYYNDLLTEQRKSASAQGVQSEIERFLKKTGAETEKVEVNTDIAEDGSIVITDVTITLSADCGKTPWEVEQAIYDEFEIVAVVSK